jgi:carbohydrate-selective porin OprB
MRRLALLAAPALGAAPAARAEEPHPLFTYVGDWNGVVAGGRSKAGTYVHALATGVEAPVGDGWSVVVQGDWTAGAALSPKAIGDVEGVQGAFNSGNGLWLYELKAQYVGDRASFQAGRLSSGDAFPGVPGMNQFVNSAFSSNGGAISLNDPGRGTTPMASWGAWGTRRFGGLELRGGAFLSDPGRMTLAKHGLDFSFAPRDGVLVFGEAVTPLAGRLAVGLGVYEDSARVQTFDGRMARGDGGAYAWLEAPPDKDQAVSGFAMLQVAPRGDRDLEPLFLIGGLTVGRVSLGAAAGRFSHESPLRGWEATLEANYRCPVNDHIALRPDLQWVISPAGRGGGRDALVLGVQLEASL